MVRRDNQLWLDLFDQADTFAVFSVHLTIRIVDLRDGDYGLTKGMYFRELDAFKWSTPDSAVLLRYTPEAALAFEGDIESIDRYGVEDFILKVFLNDKHIDTIHHSGEKRLRVHRRIPVPHLSLPASGLVQLRFRANAQLVHVHNDARALSFRLYAFGFKSQADDAYEDGK